MHTPTHETFIAPARAFPQLWRLLLGVVLTLGVYFIWILLILALVWLLAGADALTDWMARIGTASTPTSVLLLLSTFAGMAMGPMLAARLLHKRAARSLLGAGLGRDFALAAGVAVLLLGGSALLIDPGYVPQPNVEVTIWLSFLPLALVGVAVQTGAEEVLFRGYLQQQLAARFASPIVWMVGPSLLFGLLHADPTDMSATTGAIIAATTLFGLLAADLTRVTGNIGAAWGFHFINNCFAILIVAMNGDISGLALYVTPFTMDNTEIIQPLIYRGMAVSVLVWAAVRGVLHLRDRRA